MLKQQIGVVYMKNVKRLTAIFLSVIMLFSMSVIGLAAKTEIYTETLLNELSADKKFHATVTSHTYDGHTDKMDMDFYDDLNTGNICCILNDKRIKAVYNDGNVFCTFLSFLYVFVPVNEVPFMSSAIDSLNDFQSLLNQFLDYNDLNNFNIKVTKLTRDGQTYTCEKLTGKVVTVSGTFIYDSNGELSEVLFTDTLGESIGFTLENAETDFDTSIFEPPVFKIDISFLWNLIKLFITK